MNDEEEVLTVEEPQEEPQQQPQQDHFYTSGKKESVADRLDKVGENVTNFGKAVENLGHAEEKLGGMVKGKDKAGEAVTGGVEAASSAVQTGASAVDKAATAKKAAAQGIGKTADAVGQTAGKVKDAAAASAKADEAVSQAGEKVAEAGAATAETGVGAAGAVAGTAVAAGAKAKQAVDTAIAAGAGATQGAATVAGTGAKAAEAEADAEKALAKGAEKTAGGVKKGGKLAKKGNEASSVLADKLENRGKRHIQFGKKVQEIGGQIDSEGVIDNLFGTGGYVGKLFGSLLMAILKVFNPKTIAIVITLFVTVTSLLLTYILSPMFFMDGVREFTSDPDRIEKASNYLSGLGFQDSEKAFYEELEYLNAHYDNKLDYSYIMAALYYVDVYYGEKNLFLNGDTATMCGTTEGKPCNGLQIGFQLAKSYLKEANSTLGDDGLTYSANKIYRLRQLAKSQFLGDKTIATLPLDEYIEMCIKKMDAEQKKFVEALPYILSHVIAHALGIGPIFDQATSALEKYKVASDIVKLLDGTESWASLKLYFDNGKYMTDAAGFITALNNFIDAYFSCFTNIESISIDTSKLASFVLSISVDKLINPFKTATGSGESTGSDETNNNESATSSSEGSNGIASFININYYEYSFNKDEYENYLIDYYIRYMPEFSDLIKDEDGKVSEDKIYGIAYEIKLVKELYDELYTKQQSAEGNQSCVGNMNLDLIDQLQVPIDLQVGTKITFKNTNNFGLYKGEKHDGVDLEDVSTGTKAGDKVYSVYTGTVLESTFDNTYSDKNVKGGWVAIQYIVRYADSSMGNSKLAQQYGIRTSNIIVYYGGLSEKDLKLRKGQAVKKGEVIGYVGSAAESENGVKASLHFGVYDEWSQRFLSPVNIFITCRAKETTELCGKDNKQKVWTFLLSKGYSKNAAAGIMGNWQRESGFKPYIVQSKSDSFSKKYTADIDNNIMSVTDFKNDKTGGGGYGLAQWTSENRKEALYKFAKNKGKSIGSLEVQLEFFEKEMQSSSYSKVRSKLMKSDITVDKATKIFLNGYEGGRNSGLSRRQKFANEIYNELKDFTCE